MFFVLVKLLFQLVVNLPGVSCKVKQQFKEADFKNQVTLQGFLNEFFAKNVISLPKSLKICNLFKYLIPVTAELVKTTNSKRSTAKFNF